MRFTISCSASRGDPVNCRYPELIQVAGKEDLARVARTDHVCARLKNNYRSKDNFLRSDVIVMDCDNDGSEENWIYMNDLEEIFGFEVSFAAVASRNDMRPKGKKAARPRFHVYFPIRETSSAKEYEGLKQKILKEYPFFDENAVDAARFIFGVEAPKVLWHDSLTTIDAELEHAPEEIHEGSRNTTMSRYAGRLLIRLGDSEEAWQLYQAKAAQCVPPLDQSELMSIWASAHKLFRFVSSQPGYVPPEDYRKEDKYKYRPERFTDIGEASMFARFCDGRLLYSPATKFLFYTGRVWEESEELARQVMHDFTEAQLNEVEEDLERLKGEYRDLKIADKFTTRKTLRKGMTLSPEEERIKFEMDDCERYYELGLAYQDSNNISKILREIKPRILVSPTDLDKNPLLLNTPGGTLDLMTGEMRAHDPRDYLTKITAVSPSLKGMDIWKEALDTFFCKDRELIDYVQLVMGMVLIGEVKEEKLYIFYGDGRNGKSTFTNTCARVLGTYSGAISADVLTTYCKTNALAQFAELKGKRMLVASELESNQRLSASTAKKLSSTDAVFAEKKYKAPFEFVPTHTMILHTNHLPNVVDYDTGIWRRLTVIPFTAVIQDSNDHKNYAAYLIDEAGGAVLQWMAEGARKVIASDFKLHLPHQVCEATNSYKQESDWISEFIEACCRLDPASVSKAGELYSVYQGYCEKLYERPKTKKAFKDGLAEHGIQHKKTNKGAFYHGIRPISDLEADEDSLPF